MFIYKWLVGVALGLAVGFRWLSSSSTAEARGPRAETQCSWSNVGVRPTGLTPDLGYFHM